MSRFVWNFVAIFVFGVLGAIAWRLDNDPGNWLPEPVAILAIALGALCYAMFVCLLEKK